jgi:hypothetical protein
VNQGNAELGETSSVPERLKQSHTEMRFIGAQNKDNTKSTLLLNYIHFDLPNFYQKVKKLKTLQGRTL